MRHGPVEFRTHAPVSMLPCRAVGDRVCYPPIMTPEDIRQRSKGTLIERMGIEWKYARFGETLAYIPVTPAHLAPNGYLHAATVVALADSACGFGCLVSLPEGARSFTTIELKSNFLGTATSGDITCKATLAHGGRTTQIWDAVISSDTRSDIALFRCTQLLLYPK